jgi:hypothetical protein
MILSFVINLTAKDNGNKQGFSSFNFAFLIGINFQETTNLGGLFQVEVKTNITDDLFVNLILGYSKSFSGETYTVRTYRSGIVEGQEYYYAEVYNVNGKGYDIFPFSCGFQYVFKYQTISPYLLFNLSYNFIVDTKFYRSPSNILIYNLYEELPDIYRTKPIYNISDRSLGVIVGFGTLYHITSRFNLDFRYVYKYDNKIINTHQLLIGINI